MFLPRAGLNGASLAGQLALDVMAVYTEPLSILQSGGWWIVAAEADWLTRFRGELTVVDYFERIVPFPELSVNSMHFEPVIAAFSSHLSIATPSGFESIVGLVPDARLLDQIGVHFPLWQRLLAFQLE